MVSKVENSEGLRNLNSICLNSEAVMIDRGDLAAEIGDINLYSAVNDIAIETNGTVELEEGLVDWICVSPKDMLYPEFSIKQRKGDELKVVYTGQDLSMYDNLKEGFENLFLQPCYDESKDAGTNGKTFHGTFERVMQNPGWNLSLQTHKWMGVD